MLLIAVAGALQLGVMTHCDAMVQRVIDNSHLGRVRSLYGLPRGGLLPGVGWHVVGPTVALGGSGRVGLALATCLPAPDPAAGTPSVHNVPAVRPSTVNRYPGGMPIIRVNRTYR